MNDPERPWRAHFQITCRTCRREGTDQPLVIEEWCEECAQDIAASHRGRGHDIEVIAA